jgi:hypothetical protein
MKLQVKIALVTGALALGASPAALAAGKPDGVPPENHGAPNGKGPTSAPSSPTPGPKAGLPTKAKAYGRYCRTESRKREAGEKGTAFSRCVTNMAQAANREHMAPGRVCKGESRKREAGEKDTAFSRCVRDVAHLRRTERRAERQQRREEREAKHQEGS